jgi:hypothetical protein
MGPGGSSARGFVEEAMRGQDGQRSALMLAGALASGAMAQVAFAQEQAADGATDEKAAFTWGRRPTSLNRCPAASTSTSGTSTTC